MALDRARSRATQDLVTAIKHEPTTHRAIRELLLNFRHPLVGASVPALLFTTFALP